MHHGFSGAEQLMQEDIDRGHSGAAVSYSGEGSLRPDRAQTQQL